MKINIISPKTPSPLLSTKCHPGTETEVGCFDDCHTPDGTTGATSGDYLLIPGGMYIEDTVLSSTTRVYKNDYFCGVGLANLAENKVKVNPSGPAFVRSLHTYFIRM